MAARRKKKRWKKVLPTITLTAIPLTVTCQTANAFFPPVVPPPPVVVTVPPVSPPPVIVVPPVSPPPFSPPPSPPTIVVPPVSPPLSPPTTSTPEPATLITGLMGLAAVAGYRLVRRKDNEKTTDSK
jgi:hypothetical protein